MDNNITKIQEIISKDKDYINLINTNFSPFRSLKINQTLEKASKEYFATNTYEPDSKGLASARTAISKYYADKQHAVDINKIFVTASSSESYSLIFNTLRDSKDEVLLPNPTYPLFDYIANLSNLNPVYYALNESDSWQPDLQDLASKITTKTKSIVLISPNNPTGSIISETNFIKILQIAEKHNISVIIDEVFTDYNFADSYTKIDFNKYKTNIFILNGISKTLASPDLKLAWIVANNCVSSETIENMELINDCYLNANYFSQFALQYILPLVSDVKNEIMPILEKNVNSLKQFCQENSNHFECNIPKGGIHVMIKIKNLKNEEQLVCDLLKEKKVNTHPSYFYDYDSAAAHLVISTLQNPENFQKGLSRIRDFVIQ